MHIDGVLVGWRHHVMDLDRIVLTLQTRATSDPKAVDETHAFLTQQQAGLLANYLFELAGQTSPDKRSRSWFRRMFG